MPAQEPEEIGQVKNNEMLPTMAGTEKKKGRSKRKKNSHVSEARESCGRTGGTERDTQAVASASCSAFLCNVGQNIYFFHCLLQSKANSISPSHKKDWKGEGMGIQSFSECQVITSCDGDTML